MKRKTAVYSFSAGYPLYNLFIFQFLGALKRTMILIIYLFFWLSTVAVSCGVTLYSLTNKIKKMLINHFTTTQSAEEDCVIRRKATK